MSASKNSETMLENSEEETRFHGQGNSKLRDHRLHLSIENLEISQVQENRAQATVK